MTLSLFILFISISTLVVECHFSSTETNGPHHVCQHHLVMKELMKRNPKNFAPVSHTIGVQRRKRHTEAMKWGRLRVAWDFTWSEKEPSAFVKDVLAKAADQLSELLQVQQVQGAKLKLEMACTNSSTDGRCLARSSEVYCGDPDKNEMKIPLSLFTSGVSNADLVIFPRLGQLPAGVRAIGRICFLTPYNRPTVGGIDLSEDISPLPENSTEYKSLMTVLLHEITHVLGFSESVLKYYRRPDGKPYPNGVIKQETLSGITVYKMVTPKVVQEVRKYFNCSSLDGAELENDGGTNSAQSHWQQRTFDGEYMSPVVRYESAGVISPLTLAALEDSSWYKVVNKQKATFPLWGKNQGCDFATKKCIENGVSNFPNHFCSENQRVGCLPSGFRGMCNFKKYII